MEISQAQIIEVISSAAIFIVLWRIVGNRLFKPYLAVLEEREKRTVGDETSVREVEQKAREVESQIEAELKAAQLEGIQVRDTQVDKARDEAASITDHAHDTARREVEAARDEIERLKTEARSQLASESEALAAVLLENIMPQRSGSTVH